MSHSKSKVIIAGVIIIIFLIGYFFKSEIRAIIPEKPKVVTELNGFDVGTEIKVYKNLPSGFPSDLILDDTDLESANTITMPDGKTKITVAYISEKTISDLTSLYENNLMKNNWTDVRPIPYEKLSIINAKRGSEKVTITITRAKITKAKVTLQYEF